MKTQINQQLRQEIAALLAAKKFSNALSVIRKKLSEYPASIDLLIYEAVALLRVGNRLLASQCAEKIAQAELDTFDVEQLRELAKLCFELELYPGTKRLNEQVVARGAADVLTHYHLGIAQYRLGESANAQRNLKHCIKLRPEVGASFLQLGHAQKASGDIDDAVVSYRQYIQKMPAAAGYGYWSLADIKSFEFTKADIRVMQAAIDRGVANPLDMSAYYFALGRAMEQAGDYAKAASYYRMGNDSQAQANPFAKQSFDSLVKRLLNIGSRVPMLAAIEGASVPAAPLQGSAITPIFVVGLPRSGTTLVEQILSAHSLVQATDELPFIDRIVMSLEVSGGVEKALARNDSEERTALAAKYLADASAYLSSESKYMIDKNPNNFLHVALIKWLFPEAIIIGLNRNPRDNAISIYRQLFNAGHAYSSSLSNISHYYRRYVKLMGSWQSLFAGSIYEQRYERLVTESESQITELLGFCGLPVESLCFEFYKSKRSINTPSVTQVSQPMYSSSIGQWRRFESEFGEEFLEMDDEAISFVVSSA